MDRSIIICVLSRAICRCTVARWQVRMMRCWSSGAWMDARRGWDIGHGVGETAH